MTDDWQAYRERWERFSKTELGRLYIDYSEACIAYCQPDADNLVALGAACKAAARALSDKLMELAGV